MYFKFLPSLPALHIPKDSPPYALPILDGTKENAAGQGIWEDEEEHAHDDEEALVHWDAHCQHEHLEGGMFPRDGEEPQDVHHEAKHVGLISLKCVKMTMNNWICRIYRPTNLLSKLKRNFLDLNIS